MACADDMHHLPLASVDVKVLKMNGEVAFEASQLDLTSCSGEELHEMVAKHMESHAALLQLLHNSELIPRSKKSLLDAGLMVNAAPASLTVVVKRYFAEAVAGVVPLTGSSKLSILSMAFNDQSCTVQLSFELLPDLSRPGTIQQIHVGCRRENETGPYEQPQCVYNRSPVGDSSWQHCHIDFYAAQSGVYNVRAHTATQFSENRALRKWNTNPDCTSTTRLLGRFYIHGDLTL
mmetsp:Transcript_47132/g.88290  ORF Transcript_47132/g.88290 Transcript_47132/m.88290 type:complete len:234 (+) Transcript_47132:62-763(+)